jgi:hypothetical protein
MNHRNIPSYISLLASCLLLVSANLNAQDSDPVTEPLRIGNVETVEKTGQLAASPIQSPGSAVTAAASVLVTPPSSIATIAAMAGTDPGICLIVSDVLQEFCAQFPQDSYCKTP